MASTNNDDLPEVPETAVPALASHFRLQFEKTQDSWVLLYPEGMIKLNQSAGEILKRCDAERDVTAIVADLEETFGETGLTGDVIGFLQIASQQNWVTFK